MPGRKAKPPRLWLRERAGRDPVWVVLYRGKEVSTECGPSDHSGAARFLAAFIGQQHVSTVGASAPHQLSVTDVLTFYAKAKKPSEGADHRTLSRYEEMLAYVAKLLEFWGEMIVSEIRGQTCRDYVEWRTSQGLKAARSGAALTKRVSISTARRDLEVLRAAINLYHAEFTLSAVPKVTLPEKAQSRERWLTRSEAARLLGASLGLVWDARLKSWAKTPDGRIQLRDKVTRTRRRHIRRFILIGLYTGTRHEAIQCLQWHPNTTGGWFDLERGRIYRRGEGERETKKRRPPAKVANRLMPHLKRWARIDREAGAALHVIHTTQGDSLSTPIRTGWEGCLADAGLGPEVIRHTLRHTAATWMMQSGVDVWEAAGMLGMTVETLQNVYGHQHPDFQEGAAQAFSGRRR